MRLSIEQQNLLEEVAEACKNEPNARVIAKYRSSGTEEYIYDFVFAEMESEQDFLQSQALFFSDEEVEDAKEEYALLLQKHQRNINGLAGKIKTMTIEELYDALFEQSKVI